MSREQYQDKANYYATQAQLDPELFSRLINKESAWNPNAYNKSSKAAGLTQVIPTTAADPPALLDISTSPFTLSVLLPMRTATSEETVSHAAIK